MAGSNDPKNLSGLIHRHWESLKKDPRQYLVSLAILAVFGFGYFWLTRSGDSKGEPSTQVQNYGNNSNVAGRDVNQTVHYSVPQGPPKLVYRETLGPVQDIRSKGYVIKFDLVNDGGGTAIVDDFEIEVLDILEWSTGAAIGALIAEYDLKVELPQTKGIVRPGNAKRHQLQSGNVDGFRLSLVPTRNGCVYFVRMKYKWADAGTGKKAELRSPVYALRFPAENRPTKAMEKLIEEQESRIDAKMIAYNVKEE